MSKHIKVDILLVTEREDNIHQKQPNFSVQKVFIKHVKLLDSLQLLSLIAIEDHQCIEIR